MGKGQKIVTTVLWALLVCAMLGVVGYGMWRERPASSVEVIREPVARYFPAPAFALIDQNSQPISNESLRGNVWVAAFIFTQCAGPCPMMSSKMAELQGAVPDKSVKLVSFTVDPERDTPDVLKKYAETFNADESRWHFLTGETQAMYDVAAGMKMAASPATPDTEIMHSTKFLLVDQRGDVRGIYGMEDPAELARLAADAGKLAANGPETTLP